MARGEASDAVEALLAASRALVGIAARSVADVDPDVTLPQYRALVVLASRGPQKVADIAAELGVAPSTGTRMCDRLIRKGLIRRHRLSTDRRVVRLMLTADGRRLVDRVMRRRRRQLATIVAATAEVWHPAALRRCAPSPWRRATFRNRTGGSAGRPTARSPDGCREHAPVRPVYCPTIALCMDYAGRSAGPSTVEEAWWTTTASTRHRAASRS